MAQSIIQYAYGEHAPTPKGTKRKQGGASRAGSSVGASSALADLDDVAGPVVPDDHSQRLNSLLSPHQYSNQPSVIHAFTISPLVQELGRQLLEE